MTDAASLASTSAEGEMAIRALLDKLVSDLDGSGDLERLEDALREFNIFEALGTVNAEIRHSNLLAWLFNPNESHGLGDTIVKRVLQRAMTQGRDGSVSAVDLDLMDLSDLEVRREWANIDILLISETNALVVAIENKIEASESKGQLRRYRERVEQDFPTSGNTLWKRVFLFLTLDSQTPSDDLYVPISYGQIIQLLEATLTNRRHSISSDIATTITHYTRMVRRHHMEDSELIQLARRLYAKHQAAFKFIFDHRPDTWSDTREILLEKLRKDSRFEVDASTSRSINIRFLPSAWSDWRESLSQGTGWKSAGTTQFMLCELTPSTNRDRARLQLVLGPGPSDARESIMTALRQSNIYKQNHTPSWTTVLTKPWRTLIKDDQEDPQGSAKVLHADIDDFASNDVPKLIEALRTAFNGLENTKAQLPPA